MKKLLLIMVMVLMIMVVFSVCFAEIIRTPRGSFSTTGTTSTSGSGALISTSGSGRSGSGATSTSGSGRSGSGATSTSGSGRSGSGTGTGSQTATVVVTEVQIKLVEPEYGKTFDFNPTYVTTQVKPDPSRKVYWEGHNLTSAGGWVGQTETSTAVETKYRANIYFVMLDERCELSSTATATINGVKNIPIKRLLSGSSEYYLVTTPEYEVKAKEEAAKLESATITVDGPELGEKYPAKAKVKTNLVDYKEVAIPTKAGEIKIEWVPGYHAEIQPETEYMIQVSIPVGEAVLSDNFKATVNGKEAKSTKNGDSVVVTYKFPKTDKEEEKEEEKKEEVTKVVWASASKWALDELNKANEAGLIPTIFDKEDLTKNITRKEFAHVAVKLYEKVSGKKAAKVSKNPFTDTKDEEVLKAYNVGITAGMSETTFEPDTLITREQMATMMTRALNKAGINTKVDLEKVKKFDDDAEMHSWGKDSIYYMSNIEIIKGMGDNKFGVLGNATREQSLLISVRSAEKFAK